MKKLCLLILFAIVAAAITNGQTPKTLVKTVSTLPATCTSGVPQTEQVFKTGSGAGLYYCDGIHPWALVVTAGVPGLFSINGMTGSAQLIAIGTAGTAPAIVSSGDTTTINIPSAGSSASGIITNGTQTIAGAKTFSSPVTIQHGATTGVALDISDGDPNGSSVNNRNNASGSTASFDLSNDASKVAFTRIYGSTVAGSQFTNGPLNASSAKLASSTADLSIHQFGSNGNIWFSTNDTARARINSTGFTQWGTTSGTSTITPQAVAGSYVFKLPNTNPTVGQNVFVSAFSAGTVTLDYQDGGSGSTGLYDLMGAADGAMSPSQILLNAKAARAFTLAVTGSVCGSEVAATAQTDFTITVNGVNKGTLRFAASGTSCTVVSPVGTSIAINDKIKIVGPASPDATLSGVTFTLKSSTPDASAYDLGQQANGDIAPSQLIMNVKAVRAFTLPITGSVCSSEVAATAQADFLITVNGTTKGTLRFAAAGTTCSIVGASSTSISIGDKIKIIAPASPDATLADVTFTLLGSNP